eukprot:765491-Hanusia_phi.AAC.3
MERGRRIGEDDGSGGEEEKEEEEEENSGFKFLPVTPICRLRLQIRQLQERRTRLHNKPSNMFSIVYHVTESKGQEGAGEED